MKDYELLITLEVLEFFEQQSRKVRLVLRAGSDSIKFNPYRISIATQYDSNGRLSHLTVIGKFVLEYWIDAADEHVKIMRIRLVDY